MGSPNNSRLSVSDRRRNRDTMTRSIPALGLLLVTQGSLILADPGRPSNALQVAWALSPMIAILWLAWVQVQSLRRADEFQRVVQLESLAIGFGAMVIVGLSGGLLDGADIGDPGQSLQLTLGIGVVTWVLALPARSRPGR